MDERKTADGAHVLFTQYIDLMLEVASLTPASNFISGPAADRLDVAVANLNNSEASNAAELALQVLSLEPKSAYAYTVWALALAKSGNSEQSLIAFDVAVDLDPMFLLPICGKILMLNVYGDSPGLSQEIALLRRQLGDAYNANNNDIAKMFVPLLGKLGKPPETTIRYANIGGGPNYNYPQWRNLDSVRSENNPEPIRFSPESTFPLDNDSVEIVYTSHCLEHLDDPTVARALAEARRIVKPDGVLLVKLPDFDRTLDDWRRQEESLLCAPVWGIEALLPMWEKRGVADNLDNRAAFIFSGFWNHAYGDENSFFSGEGEDRDDAYLGPPVMSAATFHGIAQGGSPHDIAATLRQHIVDTEPSYHFNHQNAWSRDEFEAVLAAHGFSVLSFDRQKIAARYRRVPLIDDMDFMSMYCLAVPGA